MPRKVVPGPLAGKQPDGDTVVAEIRKSESDTLVVKATVYNGYPSIHARIAYHADNGELRYTRKGFSVKAGEQLEALIKGLTEAGRLLGAPPVTSQPPPTPEAPAPSSSNGSAEVTRGAREPQSETARLILKNNPRLTLEQINADRVARGLEPLT